MENNQKIKAPVLIEDLGMQFANYNSKNKSRYGIHKCNCGNEFRAVIGDVARGATKSCGCINRKHGYRNHRLYYTWQQMIQRTTIATHKSYKNYGGRGIAVCDRWQDVSIFIEDMFPSYVEGLSIDRIDNNGNYEPSNCRWTTRTMQAQNTRAIRSVNTSGYRGVSWSTKEKKWVSQISISYKKNSYRKI